MKSGKSDDITTLENDLKQANSELKKILAKREQYEMHAPIRGMIRSVKVLVGDNISTSSTTGNEGTITIEDNNAVMVVAKLNQKDIVKINQNQAVSITLDTFPDISFSGKVVEISSSPDEVGGG
jgi:HlyD family secretion protein